MDDSNEDLKGKSIYANTSEFFVFLPNDLNQIKSNSRLKGNENFVGGIAAKDEGNIYFQNQQYESAIRTYSVAIEKFGNSQRVCNLELAACYQNRAAAKMYLRQYDDAISDASKAIELNDHYSKAYFRRAKAYSEQRKYYRALQDIVQACILERFKNRTYTDMVAVLLNQIDAHPSTLQWKMAYSEMEADELYCDHCMGNQIKFIKNCGILDLVSVAIPNDHQPHTGYIKAMEGLKELNLSKIMDGCNEEETVNGEYLAESFIVRAYMNTVVVTSPRILKLEFPKELRRMNELIWNEKSSANIKFNALLCRANMYNIQRKFEDANRDLESLEQKHQNNAPLSIIKSGALMQLSLHHPEFIEPLIKCCRLRPNVFELQMQLMLAEVAILKTSALRTAARIVKLEQLINRFPNVIEPRVCLAGIYAKIGDTQKAKKILKKSARDLPHHTNELNGVYGMLKSNHASCIPYFKRSLEFNKDDPLALSGMLEYFYSTTREYAKAIEVSTKGLYSFLQRDDFQEMFEHRQALLKRIASQGFWDQL